jgi:hypothetical protein
MFCGLLRSIAIVVGVTDVGFTAGARPRNRERSETVILSVMSATRGGFGVCVVTAALLVASCSGGGKQSAAPTTTTSPTAVVYQPIRGCPPSGRALAECIARHKPVPVDPCPKTNPNWSPAKSNAGVAGLDKELVPIEATKVLSCRWNSDGRLNDGGYISEGASGAPFVKATSQIPSSLKRDPPNVPVPGKGIGSQPMFFVFSGRSQQVTLRLDSDGVLTNGVRFGVPTVNWLGYFLAI